MPFRCVFVATSAVLSLFGIAGSAVAAEITGAGASFPAPVYAKWADAYQKATGNKINYQSIGSSGGLKQIRAKTIDFGASDAPLKPETLQKDGLVQFPTVIGGVVPVVNLPGVKPGQLKLTGALLAHIYLGKVKKWNDPEIVKLNTGVSLPDQQVAVIRRADGSGTSFIFTDYLSKVSPEWAEKVGVGTAPQWPTGTGGKGNEGVSAFVQQLPGAIGYVEYAYAKQNKLTHVSLQNADGQFVQPDDANFKAAAAGADWAKSSFYQILTNQPGKESWPITGATFIVMQAAAERPAQSAEVLKFFEWAYKNGATTAAELDYVPLPDNLVKLIHNSWANIKEGAGKPVYVVK